MNDGSPAERRARLRAALVKAGREERAPASLRASLLALGAAGATTTASAGAASSSATATSAPATGATAVSSVPAAASAGVPALGAATTFAVWKIAAVVAVVAGGAAVAVGSMRARPRAARPAPVAPVSPVLAPSAPAPAPAAPQPRSVSVTDLPSVADDVASTKQGPTPEAPTEAPVANAQAPAPRVSLAEEMRIVESVRRAENAGHPDEALRVLARYRRVAPGGVLAEEAEVLRIECLAQVGRAAEAKVLGERFLERHPRSAYASRVSETLARIDAPSRAHAPDEGPPATSQ